MKLEGIHHVTCITADAPGNVDFYARVLGLRLVKKTVNQDDPTVYHLFYADERGSAGADITFFEYPGIAARAGRRRHGAPDHLPRRLGGGARLLGGAARSRGRRHRARRRRAAVHRSGGSPARARRHRRARRAARRRAPRHPARARDPGLRQRARLLAGAGRKRRLPRAGARLRAARRERVGAPRRPPRRPLCVRRGARGARPRRGGDRPPRRLGVAARGARGVARARRRLGRVADAGDRPLLLQVRLLPRAERRALRAGHDRPRLHHRRAPRDARRAALPAAALRASARRARAGADAAAGRPAARAGDADRTPEAGGG